MTVETYTPPRVALGRLVRCAQRDLGSASWWACVANRLDDLRDELALTDIEGLAAQVTSDAPQYAATARRLPGLDRAVQEQAEQLRIKIGELAGNQEAACEIQSELDHLLRSVRTLYRLSDSVLVDSYERDLGGD